MKRVVLSVAALLTAFVLPGCPIYPEERGCFSHEDCPSGYACHAAGYCVLVDGNAGSGSGPQCDEPKDCRVNETCGKDRRCHVGDCTFHGCVTGFECRSVDRSWACTQSSSTGGAGGSSGYGGDAAADSSQPDVNAGGTGGTGPDGAAPDGSAGDGASDSASDAPGDSATDASSDAANDAASDAARDSASDAPRG